MSGIHFLLIGIALFGFLPLAIVLYKKRLVKKMLTTGLKAKGTIYNIRRTLRSPQQDIVSYFFHAEDGKRYTGILTTGPAVYAAGDVLDIYYLRNNPKRSTVKGAWGSPVIFVFVIIIAIAVLFMTYKLYEMVGAGQL
ncbi:DUF3592 domain-containing protein [Pseudobacter ginsenosidimutans]|uniref:Uncharacterized protein DUF3592 n=1 Tax=Pseudobacter ginsenosidimutans TaxID=661488 RepID=A0A4Q7N1T6_9BACT|nr:DUF3592 domain-containing protein [Pseudobacter ginsenosidimutans]RZS74564.1 uncharacterized protein DUF3592 [Pseudobacter ginsenosidimutans]